MKEPAAQLRVTAATRSNNDEGVAAVGPQNARLTQLAESMNARAQGASENHTGLPDRLKSGIEAMSGISMDAVRVHYNSDRPAQLNAHAFAQGTDIHVAPGQERHVPHEAWHVVQQAQGRVRPTRMLKSRVAVNDDVSLEREADRMGSKALSIGGTAQAMSEEPPALDAMPVQREIENATYGEHDADDAKAFVSACNVAVQKAYAFVISVPSLGPFADLDGRTAHWLRLWSDHLADKRPKLLAAAFGYAIESLVTNAPEFMPEKPSGCTVLPQVVVGGTRPDLVLSKEGKMIAWVDLTASASADHIFDKDDWASKIHNFAEVTYPSLDLSTLALMKQNKDGKSAYSAEEVEERRKAAEIEYEKNKSFWIKTGEQFSMSAYAGKKSSSWKLDDALPRAFIQGKLIEFFGTPIELKLVPSILWAMGVNPVPWGFRIGFSMSEKAGEAWLIDNAPVS